MVRIVSTLTAVVVFVAFSPVFGQESATSATSTAPVSSKPAMEGVKKGERQETENEREGGEKGKKGKGRGHGHEKKRGLDRADEAAGEHGKQGRDRAREHGKDKHDEDEQQEKD